MHRIGLATWEEYRPAFSDWARSTVSLARAAHLTKEAELLVAENDELVVGFVCYVGPGRDREGIFLIRRGTDSAPVGGTRCPRTRLGARWLKQP